MTDKEQRQIFGDNLNYFITLKGKTQGEVADDLDIPRTTFNTWCVGKVIPGFKTLNILVEYFGCRISDLVNEHSENFDNEYQLRKIMEKQHNKQFVDRLLAYAKFLEQNPEE